MAIDVPSHVASARPVALPRLRAVAAPVGLVIAGLVSLSIVVRILGSYAFASPHFFPDEYIHGEIARSIASTGHPLVRGASAHFPALLEPLLASPFWLSGDPELAYRLTQAMQAVAVSLAAIPAYLLCRRLGLGKWFSVGGAAVALACPDLIYSSLLTGTALAYPFVLGAVYAGVCALDRPTRRSQLAFAALAGLATLARVQFVVLPVALLAAMVVLERCRVVRVARTWRLSLALYGAAAALVLAFGAKHVLGYYAGVIGLKVGGGGVLHWLAVDSMLLAFAAGAVLVPGAIAGIAASLLRPRERAASAFAALVVPFAIAIVIETALYAASGSARFQERYLFTLFPLLAPAFGIWVKRGSPGRLAVFGIGAVLFALAALVPLVGYVEGSGKQDSPLLFAIGALSDRIGVGHAGLTVGLVLGALAALALVVSFAGRRAVAVALAATVAFGASVSIAATRSEARRTVEVKGEYFPAGDRRWIDHANLGRVGLVELGHEPTALPIVQLFWNTSLWDVFLVGGAWPFDAFTAQPVSVPSDGRLLVGGTAVRESLLVPKLEGLARFTGARRIGGNDLVDLWRVTGTPRLFLLVRPMYLDGWLADRGAITVWPDRSGRVRGTLQLRLTLPAGARPAAVRLTWPGGKRVVHVSPGAVTPVRIAAASQGPWALRYAGQSGTVRMSVGPGRPVSVQARSVDFTPGASR